MVTCTEWVEIHVHAIASSAVFQVIFVRGGKSLVHALFMQKQNLDVQKLILQPGGGQQYNIPHGYIIIPPVVHNKTAKPRSRTMEEDDHAKIYCASIPTNAS